MEAHNVLLNEGYSKVKSFGTGSTVRMPGPSIDRPNVYPFGTAYEYMYTDLLAKDKQLYTQNGLLQMLDRNRRIKAAPERFQETKELFDVIITCEERVFDVACGYTISYHPTHIINVDIVDNREQASVGGQVILRLLSESKDLDVDIDGILEEFQTGTRNRILYSSQIM